MIQFTLQHIHVHDISEVGSRLTNHVRDVLQDCKKKLKEQQPQLLAVV